MKITPGTIKKLYKYNYSTESWNCKDLLEAIKDVM